MRSILTATACLALFAGLSLAETFSGRLIDASCADQQRSAAACTPTSSTAAYAIVVSGKVYRLDDSGNAKAAEAMKTRTETNNPNANSNSMQSPVAASVKGTLEGSTIKVDSIDLR